MYGIIHKAAKSTVLTWAGAAAWADIETQCGLSGQEIISVEHYEDGETIALVTAIADCFRCSVDDAFEIIGLHWADYACGAGYESLFRMAGNSLATFLPNLDRMHNGLKVTLPKAKMPSFELLRLEPGQAYQLIYRSEREGLDSFVKGILDGMADYFGESIRISYRSLGPVGTSGTLFDLIACAPAHMKQDRAALFARTRLQMLAESA